LRARTSSGCWTSPATKQLAVAPDLGAADLDVLAALRASKEAVVGQVDEVDARLDEQQRAHVRIGAARRAPAVQHGGDARGDEILGGDAVEVVVVDDRDLAGARRLVSTSCGGRARPAATAWSRGSRGVARGDVRARRHRGRV